jgi:aminoglycoside phosphotransferase family enzyme/predicted kinase
MDSRASLPDLIRALLSPAAYDHAVDVPIELIQTHISYVLLAGAYAYKIKKPVNLGFLDYSTLDKRRHMCEEEVRLNRRLCRDAYLGVAAIARQPDGGVRVDGDGEVVEYAVKMRRIPADRMMPALLDRGAAGANEMQALARLLADFHLHAGAGERIAAYGNIDAVRANWNENFAQLGPGTDLTITQSEIDELRRYVDTTLDSRAWLFTRRAAEGRVRDCHGDLRADSVVVHEDGAVCVMDCIEFSDRIRYGDVASDIGFLAMDLDYRGHAGLSDELIGAYIGATRDETLPLVLPFYKCYRAVVRAKVETILMQETEIPPEQRDAAKKRAHAYIALALEYARGRHAQSLVVVVGLAGSGKSYLANAVAGRAGFAVVSSDAVRDEISARGGGATAYGAGRYADEARAAVYDAMRARAAAYLSEGESVILDATHITRAERRRAYELARAAGAHLVVVDVRSDEAHTREHVALRESDATAASEGRWEIYLAQRDAFEPLDELPRRARLVAVDGSAALASNIEQVLSALG